MNKCSSWGKGGRQVLGLKWENRRGGGGRGQSGTVKSGPGSPFVYHAVHALGLLEVVAVGLGHGGEEGGEGEARVAVTLVLARAAHHRQLVLITCLTLRRAGHKIKAQLRYTLQVIKMSP